MYYADDETLLDNCISVLRQVNVRRSEDELKHAGAFEIEAGMEGEVVLQEQ